MVEVEGVAEPAPPPGHQARDVTGGPPHTPHMSGGRIGGGSSVLAEERVRRALLSGGAAAFVLYVALDTVSALLYDGYSYRDQTISELSAIGAETRPLWLSVGLGYGIFTLACAGGVWRSAGGRRSLQVLAVLVLAMACVSLFAWPLAPMHQREVLADGGGTASDTAHLVLGGVNSLLFVGAMCAGIVAFRGTMRLFTIGALAMILIGGAVTFALSPGVAEDASTTGLGIAERVAVLGSMFWIAVVAIHLMHEPQAVGAAAPVAVTSGRHDPSLERA